MRATWIVISAALHAAGCSSRSTPPDTGRPKWPDLRLDRSVPDRSRPDARAPDRAPPAEARPSELGPPDLGPPAAWKLVVAPVNEELRAVACTGGHVVAVGAKGTILRRDGVTGALSTIASTITADLYTVSFSPDGSQGVTGGKDYQIWKSTDQGQSWSLAPQCSAYLFDAFYSLHLCSAVEGFGAGIATNNAGAGYKYFAGASWVCGPSTYLGEIFYGVHRMAKSGWIVGSTAGKIYRTEDDGMTWATVPAGTSKALRAVTFAGAGLGVAVGEGGAIVRATDGKGATWSPVTSPTTADLTAVHLVDALKGWAVGANGTILATKDGGQSWSVQPSGTKAALSGVCFTSATDGWAVGAGGIILRTTTGGI